MTTVDNKVNLLDLTREQMKELLVSLGEKAFRADQLMKWIYHFCVDDFDKMTNINKDLREKLKRHCVIEAPVVVTRQDSADGTIKFVMGLKGGQEVETVWIPEKDRRTLCVSSQVGCALDCTFCSTAQQGFNRNLTVSEIIGQVWRVGQIIGSYGDTGVKPVTNVVMMGMGEPLLNLNNVVPAMDLMMEDYGFGLSKRRVTLSTSGVVPALDLLKDKIDVALAISLHAPNNQLRDQLVPVNKKYPMEEFLASAKRYVQDSRANDKVTVEYVMLDGINDSMEQAHELAHALRDTPSKINLIPFNPYPGSPYKRSSNSRIDRFNKVLQEHGYTVMVRKTRGDDIDAACGQLVGDVIDRTKRLAKKQLKGEEIAVKLSDNLSDNYKDFRIKMQNKLVVASVLCLTLLSACVSESTIVDTDRVGKPRTDMKEAARTRMSLGLNYLQRGDTSQAKYNLEKAKQLAPDMSDVDNALAYYYQQVGELEQAEEAYRASLRKDSNNADTYNNFGSFLCQINKYTEAEELLQAAIKRPGYIRVADSYENLAFCALAQKDYLRYQQFLRQSLQHNSNRTSSLYNMAVIEYAMGNLTEAKKWQSRLHQMGQVSPEATLIRYLVAYHSGDAVEQQTAEKFLLSVYPGSSEAAMLLSSDFSQSKPEQMKQAYKATLLDQPADQASTTDKPKMKIVRRKSATSTASTAAAPVAMPTEQSLSEDSAAQTIAQARPRDELSDLPAEAENLQTSSEVTAALTPVATLPAEQPTNAVVPQVEPATTSAGLPVATTETPLMAEADETPVAMPSETTATNTVLTHKVGAGDTLYNIASRYRLSVPELQQLNQLGDAALIVTGQVLRLSAEAEVVQNRPKKPAEASATEPAPASYQVADGESWFSISYKYNIKLDTLLKWNNMTADQPLSIGQTIYLRDPASPSL